LKQKSTLWTKNFTIITVGTIISAIGGTALNFAIALVVFDNTASTWMTGLYSAVTMLPGIILPILIAPYIDRCRRKPIIVGLDALSGMLYLMFSLYLWKNSFSIGMYMGFGLITNIIGTIYSLTYQSFYPDLIPKGFTQKGYSISSIIYPSITALIIPLASIIYSEFGIAIIFVTEGCLLLIASVFESCIRVQETQAGINLKEGFRIQNYKKELFGGIHYLKKEKGVRNIYLYMMTTNACGQGTNLMTMAHFQSSSILTTAMYSFLISAETVGRMFGGVVHYFIDIPKEKRFQITEKVYVIYQSLDSILLFLAYPLMIVARFICGFLGVNSATLRETAVQSYLPANMRARVNGLFTVLISIGMIVIELVAGAFGEILPYRTVSFTFGILGLIAAYFIIIRDGKIIRKIYEGNSSER
jgi:DHA3 family macrolide efflux protein-like MFS transporter